MTRQPKDTRRIAFLIPSLRCGGAERVVVNLVSAMSRRFAMVDLLVGRDEGLLREEIPDRVRVIDLGQDHMWKCVPGITWYVQRESPAVLISHMNHTNVVAAMATWRAKRRPGARTAAVFVEHSTLSARRARGVKEWAVRRLMRRAYRSADRVVGVSRGVSRDLERSLGLPNESVATIYNPVVTPELLAKADERPNHAWLQGGEAPVFVAVGTLGAHKDFACLLRAMAGVRRRLDARLVILGDGPERGSLMRLVSALQLSDCVSIPGHCANPYAALRRAAGFVLSSRYEGLPTVLIEALACGCPVVSTDCPSGPREILADGTYGALVPVGEPGALCEAMLQVASDWTGAVDRKMLVARGMEYSSERACASYERLISPWVSADLTCERNEAVGGRPEIATATGMNEL